MSDSEYDSASTPAPSTQKKPTKRNVAAPSKTSSARLSQLFGSDSDSDKESSAPPPQKKSKNQPAARVSSKSKKGRTSQVIRSDTESEEGHQEVAVAESLTKKTKPKTKKQTPSSSRNKKQDIFKILRAEEKAAGITEDRKKALWSSFTSRVASGRQRRAAIIGEGAFFIDIKIYNADDVLNVPPQTLYKKSLVTLKLQAAEGSPPWEKLQVFMQHAYSIFKDHEPVLYKD